MSLQRIADRYPKASAWSCIYSFDFSDAPEIKNGQTIVDANVTCSNNDGALLITNKTISSPIVSVLLTGGTFSPGRVYSLLCSPVFSGAPSGQTRDLPMDVEMIA